MLRIAAKTIRGPVSSLSLGKSAPKQMQRVARNNLTLSTHFGTRSIESSQRVLLLGLNALGQRHHMSTATSPKTLDIVSPIDGKRLDSIPLHTKSDLDEFILKGQSAFDGWKDISLRDRSQILYRYRNLLMENKDVLSEINHLENGKTMDEARAEIDKAIEITEFACSLPQLSTDKISEVSKGIQCRISKKPLGVVASITPFNFPSMVPNWTIPIAIAMGNCVILKPSERTPLSALKVVDLLKKAGLPDGVVQVLNGGKELVESICDHPDIQAVSFVGSTKVAKSVYERATKNHKRALCLGGAKNHLLVLPDANKEMTADNVAASMTGCAGQRCMAASVMVGIGEIDPIVDALVENARKIVPGENLGAVISKEAKDRIESYITEAEQQGATILLDGRNIKVPGKENGFYVGPTVIDHVTKDMRIAKEEVFGPVLSIIRTKDIEEGIRIQNSSNYGNGASVFTQSGKLAAAIVDRLKAGMVGVNIGVPVPREPYSFGGWGESKFGVGDITGESSINFWTQDKKITTKWNPEDKKDWMS